MSRPSAETERPRRPRTSFSTRPLIWAVLVALPTAGTLTVALARFGAAQIWERYQLFLLLVVPVSAALLLGALTRVPRVSRWLFAAVGAFLLIQTARLPTLEARGYVLAAIGWMGVLIGLGWVRSRPRAAVWLAGFLVLLGLWQAVYGLAQALGGYDHVGDHFRDLGAVATGTLINANHFAGLLNMCLALAVGLLFAAWSLRRRDEVSERAAWTWMAVLACSVMGLAVVLSRSRGGMLSLAVMLAGLALLVRFRRQRTDQNSVPVSAVVLLAALILVLGAAAGLGPQIERFRKFDEDQIHRLAVYRDTAAMIVDHPLVGVGPDMYRWRFRPYQTTGTHLRYDQAHNDYLQLAAEWGVPAALLLFGFFWLRAVSSSRAFVRESDPWVAGVALGSSGAVLSILLHSTVDFNLQLASNLLVFGLIVGMAWSDHGDGPIGSRPARGEPLLGAVLTILLGWSAAEVLPRWRAEMTAHTESSLDGVVSALRHDPEAPELHHRLAIAHRDVPHYQDLARANTALEQAVTLNPYSWKYRRELAELYELNGRREEAETAYLVALELNPRNADYQWRIGNFYLRGEDWEKAAPYLRPALAGSYRLRSPALNLLTKLDADPTYIEGLWPRVPAARRQLFRGMIANGDAEDLEVIQALWEELVGSEALRPADVAAWMRLLLKTGRSETARADWMDWNRSLGRLDSRYESARESIWNGSFESEMAGIPIGWELRERDGTLRRVDGGHRGTNALRIGFDGSERSSSAQLSQRVAVEPGRYRLSFAARSEDAALSVRVRDSEGKTLFESKRLRSEEWSRHSADLVVEGRALTVSFSGSAAGEGALFVDDVGLVRANQDGSDEEDR